MIRLDTWLNQLGLDKYLEVFEELEVDMEVMADLTEADLEKINIPLGPRKNWSRRLRHSRPPQSPAPATIQKAAPSVVS
jgi:hypothetical protein